MKKLLLSLVPFLIIGSTASTLVACNTQSGNIGGDKPIKPDPTPNPEPEVPFEGKYEISFEDFLTKFPTLPNWTGQKFDGDFNISSYEVASQFGTTNIEYKKWLQEVGSGNGIVPWKSQLTHGLMGTSKWMGVFNEQNPNIRRNFWKFHDADLFDYSKSLTPSATLDGKTIDKYDGWYTISLTREGMKRLKKEHNTKLIEHFKEEMGDDFNEFDFTDDNFGITGTVTINYFLIFENK